MSVKREDDTVVLEDMIHRGKWVSYMGTLVSCAQFLDPDVTEAWLWGGTGYAFSLTVHKQLCPSGPYMPVGKFGHLIPNTGFTLDESKVEAEAEDAAASRDTMFAEACKAIDDGLPVMGWSLEHIDWYPVHGCDESGNYLFLCHNGKPGKYPHAELGEKAPGGLALLSIVRKGPAPEVAAALRGALAFAAKMGRGECSHEEYTSGLGGYDVWIKALEQPDDPPADGPCFGHAFNAACWYECRQQAVAFLEEANRRLADDKLTPLFEKAIGHYRTVADQFTTLTDLYPCQPGNGVAMRERFENDALRRQAVETLTVARSAETEGLAVLAEIHAALAQD